MLNDWNLSIHYKDGTETWQAGEQTVPARNAVDAVLYNEGLYRERKDTWEQSRTLINPRRGEGICYQWSDIPQGQINPPLRQPGVQSVQRQKEPVPDNPASAEKGNRSFADVTADPPPVTLN